VRVSSVWVTAGALFLGSVGAAAQTVVLQIKPRVGDTLRMRLDQQTEMIGVKQVNGSESTASVVSTMQMFSRAIVEGNTLTGTTVLAVTDSVRVSSTDPRAGGVLDRAQPQLV